MSALPIEFRNGHLFAEFPAGRWLIDTGAPSSFGEPESISIEGDVFRVADNYLGLTAAELSRHVGVDCVGLIGTDILNNYDQLIDIPGGLITTTTDELPSFGSSLELSQYQGIPIITVQIAGVNRRMYFDTGAKISYYQDDDIEQFPQAGELTDFYPGFGEFQTVTYQVQMSLGNKDFTIRCGRLPDLLGAMLAMGGTSGIIGNQIMEDKIVGYFPRRKTLCL